MNSFEIWVWKPDQSLQGWNSITLNKSVDSRKNFLIFEVSTIDTQTGSKVSSFWCPFLKINFRQNHPNWTPHQLASIFAPPRHLKKYASISENSLWLKWRQLSSSQAYQTWWLLRGFQNWIQNWFERVDEIVDDIWFRSLRFVLIMFRSWTITSSGSDVSEGLHFSYDQPHASIFLRQPYEPSW